MAHKLSARVELPASALRFIKDYKHNFTATDIHFMQKGSNCNFDEGFWNGIFLFGRAK